MSDSVLLINQIIRCSTVVRHLNKPQLASAQLYDTLIIYRCMCKLVPYLPFWIARQATANQICNLNKLVQHNTHCSCVAQAGMMTPIYISDKHHVLTKSYGGNATQTESPKY